MPTSGISVFPQSICPAAEISLQLTALWGELNRLDQESIATGSNVAEARFDEANGAICHLYGRLASVEATSLLGAAIQLRAGLSYLHSQPTPDNIERIERLVASALGVVEAAAARGPAVADGLDAGLVRLEAELKACFARVNDAHPGKDELYDAFAEQQMDLASSLEEAISLAPAHTATGIAVKVRRLMEYGTNSVWSDDLFASVLDACERMTAAPAAPMPVAREEAEGVNAYTIIIATAKAAWDYSNSVITDDDSRGAYLDAVFFPAKNAALDYQVTTLSELVLKIDFACWWATVACSIEPWEDGLRSIAQDTSRLAAMGHRPAGASLIPLQAAE